MRKQYAILSVVIALTAVAVVGAWTAAGVSPILPVPAGTLLSETSQEAILHSATVPDSLCHCSAHYKDTLTLLASTWSPRNRYQYLIAWDSLRGRVDSVAWGIEVTGYASNGNVIGRLLDSTITSTAPGQFVLPVGSQILATTYKVQIAWAAGVGADSTKPQIFKGVYLLRRMPNN